MLFSRSKRAKVIFNLNYQGETLKNCSYIFPKRTREYRVALEELFAGLVSVKEIQYID